MEIEQKHRLETLANELLRQLREALIQGNAPKTITKKLITLWPGDADLRVWLEKQAADHPMAPVRTAIVHGIAELELPSYPILLFKNLGCLFYYQRRLQDSIDYFLKHPPNSIISRSCLYSSHSELKQHRKAITLCQQWLELESKSVALTHLLGKGYREAGRFEDAIISVDQAIELAGKDTIGMALGLNEKACTYQDMGLYSLAIASSEKSIVIHPDLPFLHLRLGEIYHDLGLDEVAIISYSRAFELDVSYVIPQNNLGCLLLEQERWQEAIACFERALELHPRYSLALRNLTILHLLRGDLGRAEQNIRIAIEIEPDQPSAKLLLGVLQAFGGELSTARATWLEGLTLYREHPLRHRVQRTIYTVALGQPEQGLSDLQRILQQERPPAGLLRGALQMARLLQRGPEPLPGLAEAVSLLERGRENAPVFELNPPPTA